MLFPILLLLAAPAPAGAMEAQPTTSPAEWFTAYPAAALRASEEGRVVFELSIDAAGAVTACKVVTSSGSAVLDAATCDAARAKARFAPARDAGGRAVASTWRRATRWALPEVVPVPIASFASVAKLDLSPAGALNRCTPETRGTVPADAVGEPCAALGPGPSEAYLKLKGDARAAHALVVMETALVFDGDVGFPEQHRLGGRKLTSLIRVHFDVNGDGHVLNCRVLESVGTPRPLCPEPMGPFEVSSGKDTGRTRGATMLVTSSYQPLP